MQALTPYLQLARQLENQKRALVRVFPSAGCCSQSQSISSKLGLSDLSCSTDVIHNNHNVCLVFGFAIGLGPLVLACEHEPQGVLVLRLPLQPRRVLPVRRPRTCRCWSSIARPLGSKCGALAHMGCVKRVASGGSRHGPLMDTAV